MTPRTLPGERQERSEIALVVARSEGTGTKGVGALSTGRWWVRLARHQRRSPDPRFTLEHEHGRPLGRFHDRAPLMTRLTALASVSIVAAVGAASVASASVTIGGDIAVTGAPVQCDPGGGTICEIAQLSLAGAQTQAPSNGVVVRWRVNGASGPLALRVLRTAAGFNHTFVSTSALGTPATTGVATFPTRQPIHAGDRVGIEVGPSSEVSSTAPGPAGSSAAVWSGTPDGSAAAPLVTGDAVFAYNADVEPDADGDGFGDETQDQCPANASTPGPCPPALPSLGTTPPPDTTPPALSPSGRRARLSKRGSISFFVTSNENATGQAALSLRVPKAASTVRITKRSITLVAGRRTKVSLKLSTRNATRVRNALTKKKRLTAKITLTFEDAAGNAATEKLNLRLKR
jgi:hypothetical protein